MNDFRKTNDFRRTNSFRKNIGTNDCLALLSSDIQLAFVGKEQFFSGKHMSFPLGQFKISRICCMTLPQGSCLSPLLSNFDVTNIDNKLEEPCTLRQLAIYFIVSMNL